MFDLRMFVFTVGTARLRIFPALKFLMLLIF